MTGTLQNFARKYHTAIDKLSFEFEVLEQSEESILEGPDDGVFVSGMWLEGARWDNASQELTEARTGEMFSVRTEKTRSKFALTLM